MDKAISLLIYILMFIILLSFDSFSILTWFFSGFILNSIMVLCIVYFRKTNLAYFEKYEKKIDEILYFSLSILFISIGIFMLFDILKPFFK